MALVDTISGIGRTMRDVVGGYKAPVKSKDSPPPKPAALTPDKVKAVRDLVLKYYREGSYEKLPLARKWMRNSLMYQGYQDLEWNDTSQAYSASMDAYEDMGFPNNYYRSTIDYGVALYLKTPPVVNFSPTAEDPESHFICDASKKALPIIMKNVSYDKMRALEAKHQRLYGNSFRYAYFSVDPRFGYVTYPVMGEPQETPIDQDENGQPVTAMIPQQIATVQFPRGQEMSEIVHPLEINVRSSASQEAGGLRATPYLVRARIVDGRQLQAQNPKLNIKAGQGRYTEDLAINYKESMSEMMGDSVDPVAWYASAVKSEGVLLLQAWLRPSLYWDDPVMQKMFPSGIYAEICGESVLCTRDESLDDHWTHMPYKIIPGRFWGDGDDDLVPQQLHLNTTDQMVDKNIAYNAVPRTCVIKGATDKDKWENDPAAIQEINPMGGKTVRDLVETLPGQPLSQEVYMRRGQILQDFQYHSQVFGSAIGLHQEGVNTMGGQEQFAARTEANLTPIMLVYKDSNEQWVHQMLKIAAENWLDERVNAVMGLNGRYEFSKLRGAMLDPDRVIVEARIIPTDYADQQNFVQAVAAGVLDATDPRVRRKGLDYFGMSSELDQYAMDSKVQWKEIEKMKQGETVPARPFVDNHNAHIDVIRVYLNSDEGMDLDPQLQQIIYTHMLQHVQAQFMEQQMLMGIANAATQNAPGGGQGAPMSDTGKALKGQAAAPNQPQPSDGNQNNVKKA